MFWSTGTRPAPPAVRDKPLCNSHRKPVLRLLRRRDSLRHDDDVCVFKVFPRCPPVNLNVSTVYNHMDAVIMYSDRDPDPVNILEKTKLCLLNWRLSDSLTHGDGGCFPGKVHWSRRADGRVIFIINTLWVKVFFCQWQMLFFGQKWDKEFVGWSVRQIGGQTLLHVQLWHFLSSFKLPKTVTTLLQVCLTGVSTTLNVRNVNHKVNKWYDW